MLLQSCSTLVLTSCSNKWNRLDFDPYDKWTFILGNIKYSAREKNTANRWLICSSKPYQLAFTHIQSSINIYMGMYGNPSACQGFFFFAWLILVDGLNTRVKCYICRNFTVQRPNAYCVLCNDQHKWRMMPICNVTLCW